MVEPTRRRIVIVDDDPVIRDFLALRCTQMGLHVDAVGDGQSAVDKVWQDQPDLLIIDHNLRDTSGFRVIEQLATPRLPLPVVLLTGTTDEDLMQRCRDLNVFHVHKGPEGWDTLQALIRKILDLPLATDA